MKPQLNQEIVTLELIDKYSLEHRDLADLLDECTLKIKQIEQTQKRECVSLPYIKMEYQYEGADIEIVADFSLTEKEMLKLDKEREKLKKLKQIKSKKLLEKELAELERLKRKYE